MSQSSMELPTAFVQTFPDQRCVDLSHIYSPTQGTVERFGESSNKKGCENLYGTKWCHFLIPNDKAMSLTDVVGENKLSQRFIVCLILPKNGKNNRLFAAFDSHLDFIHHIKNIPQNNWFFFEVILGNQSQKLYFDIELYVRDLKAAGLDEDPDLFCNRLLTNLVGRIVETFGEHRQTLDISKNILLFSSSNEVKKSYHIIVDGYAVLNNIENKMLAEEILDGFPEEYLKYIDRSMYSSKQQLRLLQSQKPGSGRPKVFVEEWWYGATLIKYPYPIVDAPDYSIQEAIRFTTLFASSCVTVTNDCEIMQISSENIPTKTFKCPSFGNDDIMSDELLNAVYNRVDPKIFQIYSVYKIVDTLILLKRKRPAYCILCGRTHENENAFLRINKTGKVYFYCRRNDQQSRFVADVFDLIPGANLSQDHVQSLFDNLIFSQFNTPATPDDILVLETPSVWSVHDKMRILSSQPNPVFKRRMYF